MTTPAPKMPTDSGRAEYDPAFRPAVAAGCLTIQDAVQRGDRVRYASWLAQRYDLPTNLAFLAADNRISVSAAKKQAAAAKRPVTEAAESGSSWRSAAIVAFVAVVALIALAVGLPSERLTEDPQRRSDATAVRKTVPAPAVQALTEVRTDEAGSVTGVRGLDPESVLAAYCTSARGSVPLAPVRIAAAGEGQHLGIFRKGGSLLAIRIRRDDASNSWAAGDGQFPIVPEDADAAALDSAKASATR